MAFTASGVASSLMNELSDKPVAQVLDLLESPDSDMRVAAAFSIELRYRKDKGGPQFHAVEEQHPELPLPPQVVPRLAEHLKSDSAWRFRLEAMRALGALRSCTNTTSLVATGLEDTNACVRIWTCGALIDISHDYSDPLVSNVIPTLKQCLRVDGPEEPTWIAARISGNLASAGKPLLPDLENLSSHTSSKVQHYAREAIKEIQRGKKRL
jgi:hypothetical protein